MQTIKKYRMLLPVLGCGIAAAHADDHVATRNSATLPSALYYQGQPVEPFCFKSVPKNAMIDLRSCHSDARHTPFEVWGEDSSGHTLTSKDAPDVYMSYRYVGNSEGLLAILVQKGGRDGHFANNLALYKRDGDRLTLERTIAAGTDCSAIVGAYMDNGQLAYSQALSPASFSALAGYSPHYQAASLNTGGQADKPAHASCFGKANYVAGTLQSVDLNADNSSANSNGQPPQYADQSCFSRAYRQTLQDGGTHLSVEELNRLTRRVNQVCSGHTPRG